jgi:[ribosomal protein S5]-alanine N-acetyltransferase
MEQDDQAPIFESGRIRARPFTHRDAAFVNRLLNDPDFLRFIGDRGVRTDADASRYLDEGPLAMYAKHGHGLWRISRRADDQPIGTCGLLRRDGFADADVGYALLPEFRGAGYAREAVVATLDVAQRRFGCSRVLAFVQPDNERSLHLLEVLGFQRVGATTLPPDHRELVLLAREEGVVRCSS